MRIEDIAQEFDALTMMLSQRKHKCNIDYSVFISASNESNKKEVGTLDIERVY